MYEYTPYHPINVGENTTGVTPRENDILCGRGSTLYKHVGNKNFRFIVSVHLPKYTDPLSTRKEKGIMIQKIVNDLHGEGRRFLKEGINGWYILSHKEAKYKVGHALRDAASEMKKHMKKYNEKKASKSKSKSSEKKKVITPEKSDISSTPNTNVYNGKIEIVSSSNNVSQDPAMTGKSSAEEVKKDTLLSSMSHVISEEEDNTSENSGDDDSWFESFFHSLSPTLFDENENDPWAKEESTLVDDTLTFDVSLFS